MPDLQDKVCPLDIVQDASIQHIKTLHKHPSIMPPRTAVANTINYDFSLGTRRFDDCNIECVYRGDYTRWGSMTQAGVETGAAVLYFDLKLGPSQYRIQDFSLSFTVSRNSVCARRPRLASDATPHASGVPNTAGDQNEQENSPPSYNDLIEDGSLAEASQSKIQLDHDERRPPIMSDLFAPTCLDRHKLGLYRPGDSKTWTLTAVRTHDDTTGNPVHITWSWKNPANWHWPQFADGLTFRVVFIVLHDYHDFTVQAKLSDRSETSRRWFGRKHDSALPCVLEFQPTVDPRSLDTAVQDIKDNKSTGWLRWKLPM